MRSIAQSLTLAAATAALVDAQTVSVTFYTRGKAEFAQWITVRPLERVAVAFSDDWLRTEKNAALAHGLAQAAAHIPLSLPLLAVEEPYCTTGAVARSATSGYEGEGKGVAIYICRSDRLRASVPLESPAITAAIAHELAHPAVGLAGIKLLTRHTVRTTEIGTTACQNDDGCIDELVADAPMGFLILSECAYIDHCVRKTLAQVAGLFDRVADLTKSPYVARTRHALISCTAGIVDTTSISPTQCDNWRRAAQTITASIIIAARNLQPNRTVNFGIARPYNTRPSRNKANNPER